METPESKPEWLLKHEAGQRLLQDARASAERAIIYRNAYRVALEAAKTCPREINVWAPLLYRSVVYIGGLADVPSEELADLAVRGLELNPLPMIRDDLYEQLAQHDAASLLKRLRLKEEEFDYESGCFLSTEPKGPEQAMGNLSNLLAMIGALLKNSNELPKEVRNELVQGAITHRVLRSYQTQRRLFELQTSQKANDSKSRMFVDLLLNDLERAEEWAADIDSETKEDSSFLASVRLIHFFVSFIYGKNDNAKEILRKLFAVTDNMKPYARNELRLLSHAFGKHTRKLLDQKSPEIHSPAFYANNCRLLISAIARICHERETGPIHVHPKRESIYDAIERIYTEHDIDIASADIAIKFFERLVSELVIKSLIKTDQTKPNESLRESRSNILTESKGHSVQRQPNDVNANRLKSSNEDFSPKRSTHEGHAKTVNNITNKQKDIYHLHEYDGIPKYEIARRLQVSRRDVIASITAVKRSLKQHKSSHVNGRGASKTVPQTKSSSVKSK